MIDHQFWRYFTVLQSKVTQITQIKVFEFRINTFHFIWTFSFTAHSCHSWVQPRDCLIRAFKWDPAAWYIVLSRMRRFVLLLYPWDLFRVYLGVRTCELFLCFVLFVFLGFIVLTSLFSLFHVIGEFNRFLHRGWASLSWPLLSANFNELISSDAHNTHSQF